MVLRQYRGALKRSLLCEPRSLHCWANTEFLGYDRGVGLKFVRLDDKEAVWCGTRKRLRTTGIVRGRLMDSLDTPTIPSGFALCPPGFLFNAIVVCLATPSCLMRKCHGTV